MIIVHRINDFLFDLFPKAKAFGNSINILKEELTTFYTFGPYKPEISVNSDYIQILIDIPSIVNQQPEYDKVIAFCEKKKFAEAKKILKPLIKVNPTVSEYHRILGQILSEDGDQDEAINSLIDALKWDPKNGFALIMMGNIFSKHKDDIGTACKYYNEAIEQNPNDFIAINNLGTNLIQLGKWDEGLKYLEAAYEINPNYPNTNYGIGLANEHLGNTLTAFEYSINALKKCGVHNQDLFNHSLSLAIKTAEQWIKTETGKKVFNEYKSYLEKQVEKEIRVEVASEIPTAAKIEFAENYNRDFHLIKYNNKYLAVEHLMMHELVHLDFVIEARKINANMLFISAGNNKAKFIRDYSESIKKLTGGGGYNRESISVYINALFEGINRQVFNTPIDLFIEDFLYENYQELRPYQFISLYGLLTEGKNAVTDNRSIQLTPKEILSSSKILNLVNAIHFKSLFGFDLVSKFKAMPFELKEATRLYEEYNEYRKDKKPAEEYELVQHWAEDLKLSNYFELIDENEFRTKRNDLEGILSSIEKDPFDLESNKKFKKEEMDKFQASAKQLGLNMALVMFMVDAMQYFRNLPQIKIKEIALEIAMLGTQGIRPDGGHVYKLANVPGKNFSGYHMLAYYYASWALAIPDMLQKLNLPYDNEYMMAKQMFDGEMK